MDEDADEDFDEVEEHIDLLINGKSVLYARSFQSECRCIV